MKPPKKLAHTANTRKGMGDFYGSGVKNPVGKVRDVMGLKPMSKKSVKTPPRSLA